MPDASHSKDWRAQVAEQYDAHRREGTCKQEIAQLVLSGLRHHFTRFQQASSFLVARADAPGCGQLSSALC
jgi:hypothetical protein